MFTELLFARRVRHLVMALRHMRQYTWRHVIVAWKEVCVLRVVGALEATENANKVGIGGRIFTRILGQSLCGGALCGGVLCPFVTEVHHASCIMHHAPQVHHAPEAQPRHHFRAEVLVAHFWFVTFAQLSKKFSMMLWLRLRWPVLAGWALACWPSC
jgi:hypothetical protein